MSGLNPELLAAKTPSAAGMATGKGQDKHMRLHASSGPMEAGQVFLPLAAPWLADYEKELFGFPGTKFDDQVDSTSQAIHWASNEMGNIWAILGSSTT